MLPAGSGIDRDDFRSGVRRRSIIDEADLFVMVAVSPACSLAQIITVFGAKRSATRLVSSRPEEGRMQPAAAVVAQIARDLVYIRQRFRC